MSVIQMTYVSYFFMILSGVFGAVSVIMYFAFDIRRCRQIVRGGRFPKTMSPENGGASGQAAATERLEACEPTVPLEPDKTTLLENVSLIQDITPAR